MAVLSFYGRLPLFLFRYLLQRTVTGAGDNVQLLFFGQVDEFDGVTGYTDGKVRIFLFFGMFHSVNQLFGAEYVDVQMMSALIEITVHDLYKIADTFRLGMAEGIGMNRLGIGNAVQRPMIGQFGNGIQGG